MKSLPNIEPSAFRKGEYVGYCHGVWRIMRSAAGGGSWFAYRAVRSSCRTNEPFNFQAGTLASLSAMLTKEAETVR